MTPMSVRERIFLSVINCMMDTKESRRIRAEVCEGLAGDVVEIGFGTGLNLPHLPPAVTELQAVDPLARGQLKAKKRIEATTIPVRFVGLDGQRLPLEDESVDMALSTWTLCSIPDPVAAVRELRRVLRPGGALHFAEHGIAPEADAGVRTWQHRLNGIQGAMACGCSLTADIPKVIADGGLVVDELVTYYAKGEPKTHGSMYQGVARRPEREPGP